MEQFQSNDDRDFKKYIFLKKKFNIKHGQYCIQNLIAHDIARFTFNKRFPKIKSFFRFFVIPDTKYFNEYFTQHHIVFSVLYPDRRDHRQLIECVRDEVKGDSLLLDYSKNRKFRIVLNTKNILSSVKTVLQLRKHLLKKEMLYYAASLTYYKNFLDELERKLTPRLNVKSFVAFNSSGTPDNIFSLFLRAKNIPTYSLQHAPFVNFKQKIPADIIIVENLTAEKMLCWGEDSFGLLKQFGFGSDRYILAGNPKYKNIKLQKVNQNFRVGLVLLGRWLYDKENRELIALLQKYIQNEPSAKFEIKLHPSLNIKNYENFVNGTGISIINGKELLSDLFKSKKYDFAITYNTSAYYEPMTVGMPSLRFTKNENEDYKGLEDRFETLEQFTEVIESFKKRDPKKLKEDYENLLHLVFGYRAINYSKILN